ncbi:MAG: TnsA endonuclease N-terminal domain-containing protein [Pseudomonadota bacterium]|nr:TnsA endonuclease N-terminal domain-containing protein [Pseudomonadota bacterium]
MPIVRQVVTRSPHRRVGLVACPWFQALPVEYESLLERDFIRLALLDRDISAISHQPFVMDLGDLGRYTPDFLLLSSSSKVVVEVKPSEFASNSKNGPRLARANEMLRLQGYRFFVATEKFIHSDKRHERAAILLRHARSRLPADISREVLHKASCAPEGVAIQTLAVRAAVPVPTVLALIGQRLLRIDSSLRFNNEALVFPTGEDHGYLSA